MKTIITSIAFSIFSFTMVFGQNDVDFNSGDNWVGFMNVFNLDGTYNFGSGWEAGATPSPPPLLRSREPRCTSSTCSMSCARVKFVQLTTATPSGIEMAFTSAFPAHSSSPRRSWQRSRLPCAARRPDGVHDSIVQCRDR